MIPIARPSLGEEEKSAVLGVLSSGMLAQGKKVAEFEQKFAEFIGVKRAIATSNGTTALHTALLAHGIKEGDEVISSPFSFIATVNAIKMTGATSVFADINEKTFNIDAKLIEKAITKKTKAIMPVHLFGQSCDMGKIATIAKKYNLTIIEDACQAHGAEFQGRKVGFFGTGCFSFYPTKNMTTGEGGMITTNDNTIAAKARKIINHGSEKRYYHDIIGYNYRMTDIAAAIGIEQLKKLPMMNQQRRRNAAFLHQHLQGLPGIELPQLSEGHVFHQFTIRVKPSLSREGLRSFLEKKGIQCMVYYPLPLHQQEAYKEYHRQSFPVAERMAQEVLSLPVYPGLVEEQLYAIVQAVHEWAQP